MKCELYFAFDLAILFCGVCIGYWLRHTCGNDRSLEELRSRDADFD